MGWLKTPSSGGGALTTSTAGRASSNYFYVYQGCINIIVFFYYNNIPDIQVHTKHFFCWFTTRTVFIVEQFHRVWPWEAFGTLLTCKYWYAYSIHLQTAKVNKSKGTLKTWVQQVSSLICTLALALGAMKHSRLPPSLLIGYNMNKRIYFSQLCSQNAALDLYTSLLLY